MTDPGQHVLPGADFTREVPLPPQPPLEDEGTHGCTHCCQMPACGMEGDDCPFTSQSAPSCSKSGSSEDEVIPPEALEDSNG